MYYSRRGRDRMGRYTSRTSREGREERMRRHLRERSERRGRTSREPMYYDDRRYDSYGEYDDYDDYCDELDKWIEKLERKSKFKDVGEEGIIESAKRMNIKFDEYSEDELYATFLMLASDYDFISNEKETFIAMARAFLEDDDIEVEPSEKLCIYLKDIVLGEDY